MALIHMNLPTSLGIGDYFKTDSKKFALAITDIRILYEWNRTLSSH